jgi:putative endonuclease
MSSKLAAISSGNEGPWFLYMVECRDGSLYTGVTNDIERRLGQHNDGTGARYTRSRRPVKIRYREACNDRSTALMRECAIRLLSPKEKWALIAKFEGAPTASAEAK